MSSQRPPESWFAAAAQPPWSWRALAFLFGLLVAARRLAYRWHWLRSERLPVPVVVVGNLIVGGAGKTPLTLWLVDALRARGCSPGIISRGYGRAEAVPQAVHGDSDPRLAGDEPVLLARRSGVPVFVGAARVAAGRALLAAHPEVDILVCDDGLQHYALQRDVELAVFDTRLAGNGYLLPAGPLREPLSRLRGVHAVVFNGEPATANTAVATLPLAATLPRYTMQLQADHFYALHEPSRICTAADLRGKALLAVAGIGDPARFFRTLQALGLSAEERPFPDHHVFTAADLQAAPGTAILLTEKDAVKCAALERTAPSAEIWVLPVHAEVRNAQPGGVALLDLVLAQSGWQTR